MDKNKSKKKSHPFLRARIYLQACWTLLTNSYASGYINGTIFRAASRIYAFRD